MLNKQITEIKIPIYLLLGKNDYVTPSKLSVKYLSNLKAPKKEIFWFDKSAHCPLFEEANKFQNVIINKILKKGI